MTATHETLERVPMRYIMQTLEMSDDAIRAAGYSVNDLLHINEAIAFLSNRVKARARWSVDKAKKTQTLLADFQSRLPAKVEAAQPVSVAAPIEAQEVEAVERPSLTIIAFWVICVGLVIGHGILMRHDIIKLYAYAGEIVGALILLIKCASLLISWSREYQATSEWALMLVFLIDVYAWFLHFPVLMAANKASGVNVSDIQTGFMAGFICIFSFGALAMFRNSRI